MEGPKEVIIPEQKFLSCQSCDHYHHTMVKSGMHPIYKSDCRHPELPEKNLVFNFEHGNLSGTNISGMVETPKWCPFLQKESDFCICDYDTEVEIMSMEPPIAVCCSCGKRVKD
jgi:hypothetical protein